VAENCRGAKWGCLDCKRVLAESITAHFAPIRERARELKAHPARVEEVLAAGAARARSIARETLREARELMGFLPPVATIND